MNEGKGEVLYVVMMKALYGMLQSSLLYYKKIRQDIEDIGFEINPYDPCVVNQMIDGSNKLRRAQSSNTTGSNDHRKMQQSSEDFELVMNVTFI